jgi:hypothetical protein
MKDSRAITRFLGFALSTIIILLAAGCSTFRSEDEASLNQPSPASTSAGSLRGEAPSYEADSISKNVINKNILDWEKARAAYLRSLDYELIQQQNNDHDKYLLKSYLVESRYHLTNAENATVEEQNYQKALGEMRQAEQNFKQAIIAANTSELDKLEVTESNLEGLLKNAESNTKYGCSLPQSIQYHQIEEKIEDLITTL